MKERAILFSGAMVRAILAGSKTQTRRIMKPQPPGDFQPTVGRYHPTRVDKRYGEIYPGPEQFGAWDEEQDYEFPFGQPGDRLWVRETWQPFCAGEISEEFPLGTCIKYRADNALIKPEDWTVEQGQWCEAHETDNRWRPSIFMPRYASRITLEIGRVRVERLQQISPADAVAEGVNDTMIQLTGSAATQLARRYNFPAGDRPTREELAIANYRGLWESINGLDSWSENPWVWVIEFKRI